MKVLSLLQALTVVSDHHYQREGDSVKGGENRGRKIPQILRLNLQEDK